MTPVQIYILAALLVLALLLSGGGYVLIQNSGSELEKGALRIQKKCKELRKSNQVEEYKQCQLALDAVVTGLLDQGFLDIGKCVKNKKDSVTAICYVNVWFKKQQVYTAYPPILELVRANEKGPKAQQKSADKVNAKPKKQIEIKSLGK